MLKYFLSIFLLFYGCFACLHDCAPCIDLGTHGSHKRALDPLELLLQTILRHYSGLGNPTWVFLFLPAGQTLQPLFVTFLIIVLTAAGVFVPDLSTLSHQALGSLKKLSVLQSVVLVTCIACGTLWKICNVCQLAVDYC